MNSDEEFRGPIQPIETPSPIIVSTTIDNTATTTTPSTNEIRLLSWNLLATPYKRSPHLESEKDGLERCKQQIEYIVTSSAAVCQQQQPQQKFDIIGLQEFWCTNATYQNLWKEFASNQGYILHVLPRVNGKEDGCAMLILRSSFEEEIEFSSFTYNDWGSRVVQVAKLQYKGGDTTTTSTTITFVNTHLTFPHDNEKYSALRKHQARKLGELIVNTMMDSTVVLFGDFNTTTNDEDDALQILTDTGLLCQPQQKQPQQEPWFSHLAHTGILMPCDFVLTKGSRVLEWSLGGTLKEIVAKIFLSDHRPVHARIRLAANEKK